MKFYRQELFYHGFKIIFQPTKDHRVISSLRWVETFHIHFDRRYSDQTSVVKVINDVNNFSTRSFRFGGQDLASFRPLKGIAQLQ